MTDTDTKPWYLSRGIIGALIAGVCSVLNVGIDAEGVTEHIIAAIGAVAGIVAIIGRARASKRIGA